jgi:hypothetical protein
MGCTVSDVFCWNVGCILPECTLSCCVVSKHASLLIKFAFEREYSFQTSNSTHLVAILLQCSFSGASDGTHKLSI